MASRNVQLTKDAWIQITNEGESSGAIYHKNGVTKILYLEAPTAPSAFDSDTPVAGHTYIDDTLPFNSVSSTDRVFAFTSQDAVSLTVTPSGA